MSVLQYFKTITFPILIVKHFCSIHSKYFKPDDPQLEPLTMTPFSVDQCFQVSMPPMLMIECPTENSWRCAWRAVIQTVKSPVSISFAPTVFAY
ncbi:hypothetical protein L3Y34_011887 [Caenorhabditis briggsae]|uniref:Uncharacterized protein n=1 Tax=Caenorhabditis briggsae TaxID=6238 RepID=A0AAE8ZSI9_CAEBR|nr:hypothetical protein L3Y34_011887 [Caenorhabditis briggsae]